MAKVENYQGNLEDLESHFFPGRFVEKNRRDVEEKTTNLKAVSGIAAIFAGFSVVSLTQLKIEYPQNPLVTTFSKFVVTISVYVTISLFPQSLLTIYAVLTSVSVSNLSQNFVCFFISHVYTLRHVV